MLVMWWHSGSTTKYIQQMIWYGPTILMIKKLSEYRPLHMQILSVQCVTLSQCLAVKLPCFGPLTLQMHC